MLWISDHVVITGGAVTPQAWQEFQAETGVTAVVNMRAEEEDDFDEPLPAAYLWLPVIDHTDPSLTQLLLGAQFIHAAVETGNKVLIHCNMGIGRSRSMAMAYLIWAGHSVDEAFMQVEETTDPVYRPERRDLLETFEARVRKLQNGVDQTPDKVTT